MRHRQRSKVGKVVIVRQHNSLELITLDRHRCRRRRGRGLGREVLAFVQAGDSFVIDVIELIPDLNRADHVTRVINRRTGARQAAEVRFRVADRGDGVPAVTDLEPLRKLFVIVDELKQRLLNQVRKDAALAVNVRAPLVESRAVRLAG
jgi:hypothetical protein